MNGTYLEDRISQLERQVSELRLMVTPHKKGLPPREAAPLIGIAYATLCNRLREAIANPDKSALKEGIHFEQRGRNKRILDVAEAKKAIAENDVIFGRRKPLKGEPNHDH